MKKKTNTTLLLNRSSDLMALKNQLVAERRKFRSQFIKALSNVEINRLDEESIILKKLVA
ncbi:MAG: hypothetical protein KDC79_15920 [Cyclobacteriaceae bacterium]|nr:hypothetical protein [Cyclobacteriaceae bacterium]